MLFLCCCPAHDVGTSWSRLKCANMSGRNCVKAEGGKNCLFVLLPMCCDKSWSRLMKVEGNCCDDHLKGIAGVIICHL